MPRRSKSSERWLSRQRRDPFVRQAAAQGKVSRAHFKIEQLDKRFRLFRPGRRVLELGAAPGGWSEYIHARIGADGLLVAVDMRPVVAPAGVLVVQGHYGTADVDEALSQALGDDPVDVVVSDMAPDLSGVRAADQARAMDLAELSLAAAQHRLKRNGAIVVKVFQGDGIEPWIASAKAWFDTVKMAKPAASRSQSREMYAVGVGFVGRATGVV